MFDYIIEPIIVSIVVSIVVRWIGLIPKCPTWRQAATMQLINTVVLTMLLVAMMIAGLHLSPGMLFIAILVILWLSVRLTGRWFRNRKAPPASRQSDAPPTG